MEDGVALELLSWFQLRWVVYEEKEKHMSKKRLLFGIVALMLVWGATAAHARTCSIHLLAANLPQSPGFSFLLAIHNYAGTTENFDVIAFLPNGTQRSIVVTLAPDRLRLVGPADIPIVSGEFADVYVCWRFGAQNAIQQPGSVMLLAVGGTFTAIPPIVFAF